MKLISFKQFLNEKITKVLVYHGSPVKIDEFKYEFTNKGNDQLGSGFYFTTDIDEAKGYGDNIHKVELTFQNPINADKKGKLSYSIVQNFILNSPNLEDALWNWGDVDHEGKDKVIRKATEAYVDYQKDTIVNSLFAIANDFYPDHVKEFNENIYKFLKFDGIFKHHENGRTHYVAFFPSQIKLLQD